VSCVYDLGVFVDFFELYVSLCENKFFIFALSINVDLRRI